MSGEDSVVAGLAAAQLAAYNRADVVRFCDCYAEGVLVLDERGTATLEGIEAFRAMFGTFFQTFTDVRAEVTSRLVLGRHCIDRETWSRVHAETNRRTEGEILVRYTEQDGLIAIVEFLR